MSDDTPDAVQICIPTRKSTSDINASLVKTLRALEIPDSLEDSRISVNVSHMQPVDANRNKMVKEFLEDPNNKWLLMIDDDIVPPTNILEMVDHDKPVVSAVCTIMKGAVPQPIAVMREGQGYRQVNIGQAMDNIRDDGLLPVEGVGTGCLLIRRDVLESMHPPWFRFEYNEYGGVKLGEDFYFSDQCYQDGVDMFIDTTQITQHFKKVDLTNFAQQVASLKEDTIDEAKKNALEEANNE